MTRYALVIALFCAGVLMLGVIFACRVTAFVAAQPWIGPLLSILVILPAVFTAFVLTHAAWLKGRETGHQGLNAVMAQAGTRLAELSGRFPLVVMVMLSLGLAGQMLIQSAALVCPAPAPPCAIETHAGHRL